MSSRKVRFSLQWKFVFLVLLFILAVSGIPSLYLLNYAQRQQIQEIDKRAAVILDNLNHVASDAIVQDDLLVLNDTVLKYLTDPEIRSVAIYNADNRILYFSDGEVIVNQDSPGTNEKVREFLFDSEFAKTALASNKIVFKNFRFWHTAIVPVKQEYVSDPSRGAASLIYEYSSPIHHPNRSIYRQLGTIRLSYDTRKISQNLQETRTRILGIIGSLVLLSIAGTLLLSRYITTPIRRLARDVAEVGSGNLSHRIVNKRNDEIGLLAEEFDEMTSRLFQAQKDLLAKKLLERDMELAADIQTSLLPKGVLTRGKMEYFGVSQPAKGVGGDYFDVIAFNDTLDGVVISDVSGKGLPAALLMVMLKTIFHVVAESELRSPKLICEIANRFLFKNVSRDKFATVHFAILDHETGILRFTNSGHGKIHIFRKRTGAFEEQMVTGIPIGMLATASYSEVEIRLETGDIVVLYTDGIPEARNSRKETYGESGMLSIIQNRADQNVREITEAIFEDVGKFTGEAQRYDDMTILTLKKLS